MSTDSIFRDGRAQIRDGSVIVIDPEGEGQPAVLQTGTGIKLLVDGVQIVDRIEVTSQHEIEVQTLSEPGEIRASLDISEDELEAVVSLDIVPDKTYHLSDSGSQRVLRLEGQPTETVANIPQEMIFGVLAKKGVVIGIDEDAIGSLVRNPQQLVAVVARGLDPSPGRDARIEVKFQESGGMHLPGDDQARVDWRELTRIPTVNEGDVLAIKHPAIPGNPGLSVVGRPLYPPEPMDVDLVAGDGACLSSDGLTVSALRNGRPALNQGRFEVLPVLIAEHGVNMASGNIRFNGDVMIRGNIEETMSVITGGNIEVQGNCNHAQLIAGGHILVSGNIIGGSVLAGGIDAIHIRCREWWEELLEGLTACAGAISQLENHPQLSKAAAVRGWGVVLSQLLDTKFTRLPQVVRDLQKAYSEAPLPGTSDVESLLKLLGRRLDRRGAVQVATIDEVWDLVAQTRQLVEALPDSSDSRVSLEVAYIQGTEVRASGDIIISGQGSYQSDIYGGQTIRAEGRPGIIRGGTVTARERIIANEAGSNGGSPTLLSTNSTGRIVIKSVHPNVTVRFGEALYRFSDSDKDVTARIDEDGVLVLR